MTRLVVALAFVALAGCGSAIQTQAHAVTVAAVATQGAARLVGSAAYAEVSAACSQHPVGPARDACTAPIASRWAPADAAIGVTKATLSTWVETLHIARVAGDGADLWAPLALAASRLVADWEALRLVLAPLDVDLPALPAVVIAAATALGGAQ